MMKKIISIFILLIFLFIIFQNFSYIRNKLRANLPYKTKIFIKNFFFGKEYIDEINVYRISNYNEKTLPSTQFETINLKKKTLNYLNSTRRIHYNFFNKGIESKKFFLQNIDNFLLTVSHDGEFNIIKDLNNLNKKKISTNLDKSKIYSILDIEYINNEILISVSTLNSEKIDCTNFEIYKSQFNLKKLFFAKIFDTNTCLKNTLGGRIKEYYHSNEQGFLVTLGASDNEKNLAQKNDSFYGKILFISLNTFKSEVFSKGHRNPQGLFVKDDLIISTEHGAYGGDEINKIIYMGNYGFPISSYGDEYSFNSRLDNREDYFFKKNHEENNFIEPIFSFVPSIGISEIISVPDSFSKYWKNNYLITSLNGRSLYRVLFDKQFKKALFLEKIFIGERIRDIVYDNLSNTFVLALEETGSLGIISSPQSKDPTGKQ